MRKIIKWVVLLFLLVSIAILILLSFSHTFFAFRNPVKSDVLIVEAWISPFEVEQAIPMINSDSVTRVIIIGKNYSDDSDSIIAMFQNDFIETRQTGNNGKSGVWLYTNSSIAFNLMTIPVACELDDSLTIEVRAKGSESAGCFARFNLVVNGIYHGGAFATARDSVFTFIIPQPQEGLQSIIIHFDNDLVHQNHDRNLNIISVKVGDTEIEANEQNSFLIKNDGKYSNGFNSQADEKKNYLIQSGIPSEKIKTFSFEPAKRNQTLASARAFAGSTMFNEISSANVVSSGLHSRRTWLTYQRLLGKEITVGIINFEQSDYRKGTQEDNLSQYLHLIDEAFSYLVNWIYLKIGGK
jgi:uncharacterized SAM-binding protein YcdF (DUF218 family)